MYKEYILEVNNLFYNFNGLKAVNDCTFKLLQGSITGLIGPNGGGKTTLFNLISGNLKPVRGSIFLKGSRIDSLNSSNICTRGLTRTFQIARDLENMNIIDNMLLAAKYQRGESLFRAIINSKLTRAQEEKNIEKALTILSQVGLYAMKENYPCDLSGGQKKMLDVARAIMTSPEILLLDEPTSGASYKETQKLMDYIVKLRTENVLSIFIVEHKMEVIMKICDKIIVMNSGGIIAEGTPEEIQNNKIVKEVYLGN